jgi:hypothetical protein
LLAAAEVVTIIQILLVAAAELEDIDLQYLAKAVELIVVQKVFLQPLLEQLTQ